jgi:hypothetical protein
LHQAISKNVAATCLDFLIKLGISAKEVDNSGNTLFHEIV